MPRKSGKDGVLKPAERAAVKARIAFLDRCGFSQEEIGRDPEVNLCVVSVGRYVREIKDEYNRDILEERRRYVLEKLAQYRDVRRAAFRALSASERDQLKTVVEELENASGEGGYTKRAKTLTQRLPASEYMRIVLDTLKAERELLGLDEVVRHEVEVRGAVAVGSPLDWAKALLTPPAELVGGDPLEAEILAAEGVVVPALPASTSNGELNGHH